MNQTFDIPNISDEEIANLLRTISPLVRNDLDVLCTFKPVDPRRMSFIWDPKELKPLPYKVKELRRIRTLHTYGHPALFKPSVAEVLSQLPKDVPVETIVGFSVEGPGTAADLNQDLDALNAGYHVATTTLYTREDT